MGNIINNSLMLKLFTLKYIYLENKLCNVLQAKNELRYNNSLGILH